MNVSVLSKQHCQVISELDLYMWQGLCQACLSAGRNNIQGWYIRVVAHCCILNTTVNREGRGWTFQEAMENLLHDMEDILGHPQLQRVRETLKKKEEK